jgi:hypothetical protein
MTAEQFLGAFIAETFKEIKKINTNLEKLIALFEKRNEEPHP